MWRAEGLHHEHASIFKQAKRHHPVYGHDYAGAHRPWDRLRWAMRTLREKRHAPAFFTVP